MSFIAWRSPLLEFYRASGCCPSLAMKLEECPSLAELDGMVIACADRGQALTDDERAAEARRRAQLLKGGKR